MRGVMTTSRVETAHGAVGNTKGRVARERSAPLQQRSMIPGSFGAIARETTPSSEEVHSAEGAAEVVLECVGLHRSKAHPALRGDIRHTRARRATEDR